MQFKSKNYVHFKEVTIRKSFVQHVLETVEHLLKGGGGGIREKVLLF